MVLMLPILAVAQQQTGKSSLQSFTDQNTPAVAQWVQQARQLESQQKFTEAAQVWQKIRGELEKQFGKQSWQVTNARLAESMATQQASFSVEQLQALNQIRQHQETAASALSQGKTDVLLQNIQQAEALTSQVFGSESHMVAQIKTQSAELLRSSGRLQEAWQQLRDALPVARKTFGPQHPDTELIYYKLGVLLHSAGQSQRALDHLSQSVNISRNVYGESSPIYADRLTTLGVACQAIGQYERALEYLMQGDKIQQQVLGVDHQRRGQTLRDIGVTYLSMQESQQAQKYLSMAIQIFQKRLKENDPFLLGALSHFATSLAMDGKNTDAEKVLKKVLEGNRQVYGPDSIESAKTEFHLAVMLGKRAAFKEAGQLMSHAIEIQLNQLGPENRATQRTAAAYLIVLERLGKNDEATQLRQKFQSASTAQAPTNRK